MTADEAAIRADERERCCRAVCPHCRAGIPVVAGIGPGVWYHDDDLGSACVASGIRSMSPEPP